MVKFASDVTEKAKQGAEFQSICEAMDRSQAVISFDLNGIIQDANKNFLSVMGYALDEVQGKHHSMFAEADFAASQEYKDFWKALGRGEFQAAQYKRLGKGGKEIWIEASYNPILDPSGKPVNQISTAISGAVEEQSAATREVSSNITGVQAAANETGEASREMLAVAGELSEKSEDLQMRVEGFLQSVREM